MTEEDQVSGIALIEIVENQIEDGNPVKVKETLFRLSMTGHSREEALEYIACALAFEMSDVLEAGLAFNEKRYAKHLDMLPDMPWLED